MPRQTPAVGLLALCLLGTAIVASPSAAAAEYASMLTFDADDPMADPGGSGSRLQGQARVLSHGVVEFRGRGVVETPARPNLDPGDGDFEIGVRIRLTRGLTDSNIMQKGFYNDQWKLSLHPDRGRPRLSCRVAGDRGAVHVYTPPNAVEDGGGWHDVRCRREGDTVDLIVDGELLASGTGPIGAVGSDMPYWIGGKGMGVGDPDQFLGRIDDAYVLVGEGDAPRPTLPPTDAVTATVETEPVLGVGDAADDPAVWVHPTSPERSVVIGNDKLGALEVYDLDGQRIQRIAEGFFGNVDVRSGVELGGGVTDVVAVYRAGLRLYTIDPRTRRLRNVTDDDRGSIPVPSGGEGLCLYDSPTSGLHAFVLSRGGVVAQYHLTDQDGDGLVEGEQVRLWPVGSEAEGCVADDDDGRLYIAEEDVGIWRYGAEPDAPTGDGSRVSVDRTTSTGGRLAADVEGLAIVHEPDGGGYLIASAQAGSDSDNYYAVYDRSGTNEYQHSFRVVDGERTDGCGRTDGIEAIAAPLGPAFPRGVFICQDDVNTAPGGAGNQNFKLVPLERVVPLAPETGGPGEPGDPEPADPIVFVGADQTSVNARSVAVTVPDDVRAGDVLVLVVTGNRSNVTLSQPSGDGSWESVAGAVARSVQTRAWRTVAGDDAAGGTVTVASSAYTKLDATLVAYSGTDATDPVAAAECTNETVDRRDHTTPVVDGVPAGAWVLSHWADKTSDSTGWQDPADLAVRAEGLGSAYGRISSMTADSVGPVAGGEAGGLTGRSTSVDDKATTCTVALAPAATP